MSFIGFVFLTMLFVCINQYSKNTLKESKRLLDRFGKQ
jgi:hypothetical protein